jgi:hypothetical protein
MGYRPTISAPNGFSIELGKFYGYVDLDNLKSINWLVEHNKIEADDIDVFNWSGYGPKIKFTAEEFREFIDLYQEDINTNANNYINYPPNYQIVDMFPEFKKQCYNTKEPKTIFWG